jgi:two-component system sensor histidine kinase UhpB
MSLRFQVNLIITTLLALFASVLIGLQIDNTRRSVHEEMVGGNVVASQLLSRMQWIYGNSGLEGMAALLNQIGRIRANDVELRDDEDTVVYKSPPPTYKAGRVAPQWYSALVAPPLPPKVIQLPNGRMVLQADASRAVLDGWDDLQPMLWTVLAGFVLVNALVYALMGRVLRPLHQLVQGMRQVAHGAYDTRLQGLSGHEGRQIGQAFNHMAQSVQDSIEAKRQAKEAAQALADNRELTQTIQARIELERAAISRELHDELGQQVTAIKSVGLAIARRAAGTDASIEQSARLVMQCADQIYDGMHRLIGKLRPLALDQFGLVDALRDLLSDCQLQHPQLHIAAHLPDGQEPADDALSTAVYRIVQEAITNVLRHAKATQVEVHLRQEAGHLWLAVRDNGCGQVSQFQSSGHYGLSGMRERAQSLNGSFELLQCKPRGIEIQVRLPSIPSQPHQPPQPSPHA